MGGWGPDGHANGRRRAPVDATQNDSDDKPSPPKRGDGNSPSVCSLSEGLRLERYRRCRAGLRRLLLLVRRRPQVYDPRRGRNRHNSDAAASHRGAVRDSA